jgi:hypothetical protein
MRKRIYILGLVAVLSATGFAALGDGFKIGLKAKAGDLRKYTLSAQIDFSGTPIEFTANTTEKVTKVETDGSYVLESGQTDAKIVMGGASQDSPNGNPVVAHYKPSGEVTKIDGDASSANANAYRMATLSMLIDPGKEQQVGDSWTFDVKANKDTGAVDAKAEYKLIGEEKVGKFDTLKIKVTIKELTGDTPASSDGFVWIDKTDGSEVKTEAKWTNAPVPGAPMPVNGTVKIERVP